MFSRAPNNNSPAPSIETIPIPAHTIESKTIPNEVNSIHGFTQFNLIAPLQRAIGAMGYKEPTDVQLKSIPPGIRGEDVIAAAQTGKFIRFII